MKKMKTNLCSLVLSMVMATSATTVWAQRYENTANAKHILTPTLNWGASIDGDLALKGDALSASLAVLANLGQFSDHLNLSIGLGYRGYFDTRPPKEFIEHKTFSDYLLYTNQHGDDKGLRPMGGQIVLPVELTLNLIRVANVGVITLGCEVEGGLRIYQSDRYKRFYSDNVMTPMGLSISPGIGFSFCDDDNDFGGKITLYWRHSLLNSFNSRDLPVDKFNNRDFIGIQLTILSLDD